MCEYETDIWHNDPLIFEHKSVDCCLEVSLLTCKADVDDHMAAHKRERRKKENQLKYFTASIDAWIITTYPAIETPLSIDTSNVDEKMYLNHDTTQLLHYILPLWLGLKGSPEELCL